VSLSESIKDLLDVGLMIEDPLTGHIVTPQVLLRVFT
jgi:hypothetical protein